MKVESPLSAAARRVGILTAHPATRHRRLSIMSIASNDRAAGPKRRMTPDAGAAPVTTVRSRTVSVLLRTPAPPT